MLIGSHGHFWPNRCQMAINTRGEYDNSITLALHANEVNNVSY